jgi:hypothetical protein
MDGERKKRPHRLSRKSMSEFQGARAQMHDQVFIPKAIREWRTRGCRVIAGGYEHASPRTRELVREAADDGSLLAELFAQGQFDLHVELPQGLLLFNEVKSTLYDRHGFSIEISSFKQMAKFGTCDGLGKSARRIFRTSTGRWFGGVDCSTWNPSDHGARTFGAATSA